MILRRNEQDYQTMGCNSPDRKKHGGARRFAQFPPFQNHSLVPQTAPPVGCFPAAQPQARQRWVKRGEKQGGGLGGGSAGTLTPRQQQGKERKGKVLLRHL